MSVAGLSVVSFQMRYGVFFSIFAFAAALPAQGLAQDDFGTRPQVVVSPDLGAPWVNQFAAPQGQVVRRLNPRRLPTPEDDFYTTPTGAILVQPGTRVIRRLSPGTTGTIVPRRQAIQPQMDPIYLPRMVDYQTDQQPGTIVIDSANKFLYLVMDGGQAKRYGVGVGKEGFGWSGTQNISRKAEWPDWRPPAEMIAREREKGRVLPAHMPGGEENPLGARALYLGDTLYRIHGTNAPWTIGTNASSGCIRLRNEDVIDLYKRVGVGTKVVVL